MRPREEMRNALRARRKKIASAHERAFVNEIRYAVGWISAERMLTDVLAVAESAEPVPDVEAWLAALRDATYPEIWPTTTDAGRAVLIWKLMRHIAALAGQNPYAVWDEVTSVIIGGGANTGRQFTDTVLSPMFDFLIDHLADTHAGLFALWRYKARVEWFDRVDLHTGFASGAGQAKGEEYFNNDLQRFLFLDAGLITSAKVRLAKTEPDLLAGVDTEDPLVCEGKLFEAKPDDTGKIADGFNQVTIYAKTYSKTVGYLVIYNVSDRDIDLPHDGAGASWAPYVEDAGVRVYFIHVRAKVPDKSASKAGRADPVRIAREALFKPTSG